jgi:hypothetical protein
MSDNGLTSDTAPVSQPAAPAPAATPPTASPPPAGTGADDPLAAPPDDQAVFSRGYVDKIRGEAQRYREQASTATSSLSAYDDVFGVYPDEDRQVWFQLARDWAQDPAKAAAVMAQIAQEVLGETPQFQANAEPAAAPTLEQAVAQLTPEQVQSMIEESLAARDRGVAEQRAIDDVFAEVRAAGYDPESAEGFSVLYNANHFTGGDIAKAVEMVRAHDQKIIDDFVAGRSGRPMVSPAGGVAATPEAPAITNIDEARRATDAFLRERRGAS